MSLDSIHPKSPTSDNLFSIPNSETNLKDLIRCDNLIQRKVDEGFSVEQLRENTLSKRWGLWDVITENPLRKAMINGDIRLFNAANEAHYKRYLKAQEAHLKYSRLKCEKGLATIAIHFHTRFSSFVLSQHEQLQIRVQHYQRMFQDSMKQEYAILESIPKDTLPELHEHQLRVIQTRLKANSQMVEDIYKSFADAIDNGAPNFLV